jgi:hypothetical protein
MNRSLLHLLAFSYFVPAAVSNGHEPIPVHIDNYVRAKTDLTFRNRFERRGLGALTHLRTPTSLDNQPIIRMNRDTLYSAALVDLSTDVDAILPSGQGRYTSMQVVNQDHHSWVYTKPGEYTLTRDNVGTRYAMIVWRVFVDGVTSEDNIKANEIQDKIWIKGGGSAFKVPNWNKVDVEKITKSLNELAGSLNGVPNAFGRRNEVDPVHRLICTGSGWGGLPRKNAMYLFRTVEDNDGSTEYELVFRDVPVDAFWSVTVYNRDGYLERNAKNIYSFNNKSAKPQADGSFVIRFGNGDARTDNAIPIVPGWGYIIRLYEPQASILNGKWSFPLARSVGAPTE